MRIKLFFINKLHKIMIFGIIFKITFIEWILCGRCCSSRCSSSCRSGSCCSGSRCSSSRCRSGGLSFRSSRWCRWRCFTFSSLHRGINRMSWRWSYTIRNEFIVANLRIIREDGNRFTWYSKRNSFNQSRKNLKIKDRLEPGPNKFWKSRTN